MNQVVVEKAAHAKFSVGESVKLTEEEAEKVLSIHRPHKVLGDLKMKARRRKQHYCGISLELDKEEWLCEKWRVLSVLFRAPKSFSYKVEFRIREYE
jgi:hypothetical protein